MDIDEKIAKVIGVDYPSLIQSELPYYRAIYQAGIREVAQIINNRKGTPQGTTIDPMYSAYFYTSEIEALLNGQSKLKEWNYEET